MEGHDLVSQLATSIQSSQQWLWLAQQNAKRKVYAQAGRAQSALPQSKNSASHMGVLRQTLLSPRFVSQPLSWLFYARLSSLRVVGQPLSKPQISQPQPQGCQFGSDLQHLARTGDKCRDWRLGARVHWPKLGCDSWYWWGNRGKEG